MALPVLRRRDVSPGSLPRRTPMVSTLRCIEVPSARERRAPGEAMGVGHDARWTRMPGPPVAAPRRGDWCFPRDSWFRPRT